MHTPNLARIAAVGLTLCVPLTGALAQGLHPGQHAGHHAGHGVARLGTVEFKVDCAPATQASFNTAMALYHSFAWPQAIAAFKAIAVADPVCGMAHWGHAMSILGNPFVWPTGLTPQVLDSVVAALDAAKAAGLKTQREQDFVAAVGVFVRDHSGKPHAERMGSFDAAMADVMRRNPDDVEAKLLSALITSANFVPTDKAYGNQLRAAAILAPIFKAYPNHPGAAHYLIHSYDYPPIANQGLEAARAYAKIAPDAAHALHMPSHIFTRVGYWKDSITANKESARVSGETTPDGHHAADYMVYAHLQLAQDGGARAAMAASLGLKPVDNFAAAFAYAAMPVRIALETGDWAGAAGAALAPAGDYPWRKYPHAEANNAFGRGVGAARAGNPAQAREQQVRLHALRDAARDAKLGYWVEQVDIQAVIVGALAQCAEGKTDACLTDLNAAAQREDATEKHAVTPGPLVPAREVLAEMLMAANKPAEALAAYEAVLRKEPNRYRATAGAMMAATAAGDAAKAKTLAAALIGMCDAPDSRRTTLAEAQKVAGR